VPPRPLPARTESPRCKPLLFANSLRKVGDSGHAGKTEAAPLRFATVSPVIAFALIAIKNNVLPCPSDVIYSLEAMLNSIRNDLPPLNIWKTLYLNIFSARGQHAAGRLSIALSFQLGRELQSKFAIYSP